MKYTPWLLAGWCGLTACAVGAGEPFKQLRASEIRKAITGKEITDNFHWSDRFFANGAGRYTTLGQPKEGTWQVKDDTLCMVGHSRHNENTECFELWRSGSTIQYRLPGNGPVMAEGDLKQPGE
jgi:hypothetical protein